MKKKRGKKKNLGKLNGFSIQFLQYSEFKDLDSSKRIKKILDIVLGNHILILQGKLRPLEETRLIEDTMAMIGHLPNFKGIELAVISGKDNSGFLDKIKIGLANVLTGGNLGALTVIGPATIVKEIKRNPKKIELLLNK